MSEDKFSLSTEVEINFPRMLNSGATKWLIQYRYGENIYIYIVLHLVANTS